jgi:hypothetical protein
MSAKWGWGGGAGGVTPIAPAFYLCFDKDALIKIGSGLAAGSGSIQIFPMLWDFSGKIASADGDKVVWDYNDPSFSTDYYIMYSPDSGVTPNYVSSIGGARLFSYGDFSQLYFQDKTNKNIICFAPAVAAVPGADQHIYLHYSVDGGWTWSFYNRDIGSSRSVFSAFAVPDQTQTYCYYVITTIDYPDSPRVYHTAITRVKYSDNSMVNWDLPDGSGFNDLTEEGFFRGTCRVGDGNTLYLTTKGYASLWKLDWFAQTATELYNGNTSPFDSNQPSIKQITTTPTGTLLCTASNYVLSSSYFLKVYRSINQGATWTVINLTSSLHPVGGQREGLCDYIANSGNTLFIPFEMHDDGSGNWVLTGMKSTNDGVTWSETPTLLTNNAMDFSVPFDVSGA